ncbi:hypothetical protein [Halobacteriovorax sp.]
MKIIGHLHDIFLELYAFIILTVDKRDDELNLLLDNEESNHFSVITQE